MEEIQLGDHVQMRKSHPCGSSEWVIYRVGADIGLRCAGCDRRVMLSRNEFYKHLKKVMSKSTGGES